MVQHWKCCVRKRTAGSNPVLSANKKDGFLPIFFCCLDGIRTNLRKQAIYIILIFGVEASLQQKNALAFSKTSILSSPPIKKDGFLPIFFSLLGDVDLNLFRFAIRVLCTRHSCREFSPARNGNILSSPPRKKHAF